MRILFIMLLCSLLSGCGFFYPEYSNQKANNEQVEQLKRIADALERLVK